MTRAILCPACGGRVLPMHPEDLNAGFQRRIVHLGATKTPQGHGIRTIITSREGERHEHFEPMAGLVCDQCNAAIQGAAVAVTMWHPSREGTPGPWEKEYQPT